MSTLPNLPPPIYIVDPKTGKATAEFSRLWQLLYERIGGPNALSMADLALGGLAPTQASGPNESPDVIQAQTFPDYDDPTSQIAALREDIASQMKINRIIRSTITLSGATSGTYTISPALTNLNKCELRFLGVSNTSTTTAPESNVRIELTNTTTVTANKGSAGNTAIVSFEITEYA